MESITEIDRPAVQEVGAHSPAPIVEKLKVLLGGNHEIRQNLLTYLQQAASL